MQTVGARLVSFPFKTKGGGAEVLDPRYLLTLPDNIPLVGKVLNPRNGDTCVASVVFLNTEINVSFLLYSCIISFLSVYKTI